MTEDQPERILRLGTVLERTGLSRSTLYRKIDSGEFPRQVKLSERCVGWYQSTVDNWLDQRRGDNGADVRKLQGPAAG